MRSLLYPDPSHVSLVQLSRLPLFIGGGDLDLLSLYCRLRFAGTGLGVNEGFLSEPSRESGLPPGSLRGGAEPLDGLRESALRLRGGGDGDLESYDGDLESRRIFLRGASLTEELLRRWDAPFPPLDRPRRGGLADRDTLLGLRLGGGDGDRLYEL